MISSLNVFPPQDCEACEPDTELDCGYSQCISIAEKCDGIIQCLHDGRDEIDCQSEYNSLPFSRNSCAFFQIIKY